MYISERHPTGDVTSDTIFISFFAAIIARMGGMGGILGIPTKREIAQFNLIRPNLLYDVPWASFAFVAPHELVPLMESVCDPTQREFLVNFYIKICKQEY